MSSFRPVSLSAPAAVASGTPIHVNPRSPIGLSIGGTFVGTYKFQYSPVSDDPTVSPDSVWFDVGGAVTAAGLQRLPAGRAKRVRVKCTAWTSGTPDAVAFADAALSIENLERNFEEETLDVPVVISTAGDPLTLQDGEQAVLHLRGTFTATYQLQIALSEDGTVWHNWGRPLTAAGLIRVPVGTAQRIRLYATAYTSGTPVANVLRGFAHEEGDDEFIETLVAPGALSLFARTSLLSIDGTDAFTLADGLFEGQRKTVVVIGAATTPRGTLTMATSADSVAPVLTSLGQRLELLWSDAAGWRIIGFENRDGIAVDAVVAPGALSVNTLLTTVAVDGTDAYTLADGLFAGQMKFVRCISAANTPHGTLTPATPSGYASIEFNTAEDFAVLMWTGAAWIILASQGLTVTP